MIIENFFEKAVVLLAVGVLLVGVGWRIGSDSIARATVESPTTTRAQTANDFLHICVEEPKATCSVKVISGEYYFNLRMDYESWTITSVEQAKGLIKASNEIDRLATITH